MIIFLWILTLFLFTAVAAALLLHYLRDPDLKQGFGTISEGFKEALRDCGFSFRSRKYQLELYKWVLLEEDACEECEEKASWPAMDIAGWMEAGFPLDPKGDSACGNGCNATLVVYKTTRSRSEPV